MAACMKCLMPLIGIRSSFNSILGWVRWFRERGFVYAIYAVGACLPCCEGMGVRLAGCTQSPKPAVFFVAHSGRRMQPAGAVVRR